MSKGLFSFLTITIALFISAIYYSKSIQVPIITTLNKTKSFYHSSIEYIGNEIHKHFFQYNKIESLQTKLLKYKNLNLEMKQLKSELQDLYIEHNSSLSFNPKVELVRTISYQKFGNLNRIWINMNDYNASKIYGLVYKESVAGIIIPKAGMPLALLNKDIKSSYAVYLGKQNAPGIANGNNGENIVIKFIPTWFHIQEGDEVITSGLDKIFFKGLKVGKIISVTSSQGYQNAIVKPYYEGNSPNYFHLIRSTK